MGNTRKLSTRTKSIRTRLSPEDQERFFDMVELRRSTVGDLLREAVSFYLDHRCSSDLPAAGQSDRSPAHESSVQQASTNGKPADKLLALDYDSLDDPPRPSRFSWGG